MSLRNILLFAGAALAHTIADRNADNTFRCASDEPSAEILAAAKEFRTVEAAAFEAGETTVQVETPVNVYMHAIAATEGALLTDAKLQEQFDVMAADFASTGFKLVLAGTTKTVNANWAVDKDNQNMKKQLRKGAYKDLNMYFQDSLYRAGALGYCVFPETTTPGSDTFIRDGCNVRIDTMPGNGGQFGLGKTATHEAGHWFGLFHTFQGGCNGGDSVDDTPAQSSPSTGCPKGRDSCPSDAGLDPITNFMDYSDDNCYEEFSKGQITRMENMWKRFRADN